MGRILNQLGPKQSSRIPIHFPIFCRPMKLNFPEKIVFPFSMTEIETILFLAENSRLKIGILISEQHKINRYTDFEPLKLQNIP